MSTACLFIGWNHPIPGRESESYRVLMHEALEQVEKFKRDGWCEDYEIIGLTPHCGSMNAFFLLKGERARLDELRRTDEFEGFSMRLTRLFTGYGVVPGVTLEGIRKVAERQPNLFNA